MKPCRYDVKLTLHFHVIVKGGDAEVEEIVNNHIAAGFGGVRMRKKKMEWTKGPDVAEDEYENPDQTKMELTKGEAGKSEEAGATSMF